MGCSVKRFLGGCQQNRHLGHEEREREKERETEREREKERGERKSRGIFRSFSVKLGSPDWMQHGLQPCCGESFHAQEMHGKGPDAQAQLRVPGARGLSGQARLLCVSPHACCHATAST